MDANRAMDDAVRAAHEQDRERAEAILDMMAALPRKREAVRAIVRVLEQSRDDGAAHPELAREMANRRTLAQEQPDEDEHEPSTAELSAAFQRVLRVAGAR